MKKLISTIIVVMFLCLNSNVIYTALSKEEPEVFQIVYKAHRIDKLTFKEKKVIKASFKFLADIYQEDDVDGEFSIAQLENGGYHVKFKNLKTISSDGEEYKVNDGYGELLFDKTIFLMKSIIGP